MVGWRALAICVVALVAPAGADALQDAIAARDIVKLEAYRDSATGDEAALAKGAALALRHQDGAALGILEPLSRAAAQTDIRAGACFAMADIYLRQTLYTQVHDALACVEAQSGKPLTGEPKQILDDTAALSGVMPMQLVKPVSGALPVRRDEAGLLRVRVAINGSEQRAVIDTDASFSVLSRSAAERLGVRIIDVPLAILTASRAAQPMHLGVADRVQFGDAVLTNVVFAVLPDKAMGFGPTYSMSAVIGLPVLVALKRIELAREDGSSVLRYGSAPGTALSPEANLALSGLDPFVVVKAEPGGAFLRLALDTAADKTALNATAIREFPALGEGASAGWVHWAGAGGDSTDNRALVLDTLQLNVAGKPVLLRRVKVLSADERDRHGTFGQDVLEKSRGWVLDFEAMRFTLAD